MVPSVSDSYRLVQEALCACSEKKKMGSLSQWGFCYFSWGAQETQTKYLGPLCLKYLSIALDTMSTHASSVCYSSKLPFCPQHFFFSIKATVFRADIRVSSVCLFCRTAKFLWLIKVKSTYDSLVMKTVENASFPV